MLEEIISPLLEWYRRNKRILPWRDRNNAYYTWVSEIMLQQTRVEAVKPYFLRFISELPDVQALAECPEEKLLKLWEGLGYYNRVRNMQEAAKTIKEKYNGRLPEAFEALMSLKGIGSYTAGAIASIAYGIPVPAVDGNVLRVITRLTEDSGDVAKQSVKKRIEAELLKLMPEECPGDFNQALMELGAVVCVPNGQAKCGQCPLAELCGAYAHGTIDEFPVKTAKAARTIEKRTVFVIQDGERTAISRRPDKGLLAGMYQLPNEEGHFSKKDALNFVERMGLEALYIEKLKPAKHIFSHIEWRMNAYRIRVSALNSTENQEYIFADREQINREYAIPSAFGAYIKYIN